MKYVQIYHPKTKATVAVPASAVRQHKLAGWRLKDQKSSNNEGVGSDS